MCASEWFNFIAASQIQSNGNVEHAVIYVVHTVRLTAFNAFYTNARRLLSQSSKTKVLGVYSISKWAHNEPKARSYRRLDTIKICNEQMECRRKATQRQINTVYECGHNRSREHNGKSKIEKYDGNRTCMPIVALRSCAFSIAFYLELWALAHPANTHWEISIKNVAQKRAI